GQRRPSIIFGACRGSWAGSLLQYGDGSVRLDDAGSCDSSVSRLSDSGRVAVPALAGPRTEAIHVEVYHRRGVENQYLADDQPTDNGDAQRLAHFSAIPGAQGQRQRTQY